MSSHLSELIRNAKFGCAILMCSIAWPLAAQNYIPASPLPADTGALPGGSPSLGQIESVNPVTGNLSLTIPLGNLPPGPGGFSAGVNLVYNSGFYTQYTDISGGALRELYQFGGNVLQPLPTGGWSYGGNCILWSAITTQPNFGASTYLMTPDGSNHLLLLVSTITSGGAAGPSFNTNYPGQPIYDIDFSNSVEFSGTLIFSTIDSSFVRVESNTAQKQWTAYFPDGTQYSGTFETAAFSSESTTIQDRNLNTITQTDVCYEGALCETALTDQYSRSVTIEYGEETCTAPNGNTCPTQSFVWTDYVTSPGVDTPVTSIVNWQTYNFTGPSYDCTYSGPNNFGQCQLTQNEVVPVVVASIQLPSATNNGPSTVYQFGYNPPSGSLAWGELHTISRNVLTSGTNLSPCATNSSSCPQLYQVNYSYWFDSSANHRYMGTLINPMHARILNYTENRDGTTTALSETTTYVIPVTTSFNPSSPPPKGGTSTVTLPDNSPTQIYSQTFCSNTQSGTCSALVYKVVNPDNTINEIGWSANTAPPGAPTGGFINPFPQFTVQTIGSEAKGAQVSQDVNGNTKNVNEYDWFSPSSITRTNNVVSGIGATAARTTSSNFATSVPYWTHGGPTYLRAPSSASVGSASTTFSFDNPLTTANLTQQTWFNNVSGGNISQNWTYVQVNGKPNGNVATATDPNGVVTNTIYDSSSLYPIEVDQAYQRTEQRTTKPSYDFNSGLLLSSIDSDNHVTFTYTYDYLRRQTKVEQAGSGGLDRTTSTLYDDIGLTVTTTQNQTGLTSSTSYDPLGRVRLTTDTAGNKVQKSYRSVATGLRYVLSSNPYAPGTTPTAWTFTTQNPVSEVSTSQTYNGSDPPAPWGGGTSTLTGTTQTTALDTSTETCSTSPCTGPAQDIQDQANNVTKYIQDGLGRLAKLIDANNQTTKYTYDLLDNMSGVTLGSQTRTFQYSTLSRLTQATNPETGTESYTYDNNGNLLTLTDARSITTNYLGYDGLNRAHSKTYTNAPGTPPVTYSYDTDWKGALSSISASSGSSTYSTSYTHDGFGRIQTSTQVTGASPGYGFVYTYSLADQLTSIQYPSGRIVAYTPDSAGRVSAVLNAATQKPYASQITYTAANAVQSLTLGNSLTETTSFNDRLQPTGVTIANSGGSLLALGLYPCPQQGTTVTVTSCTTNNVGNLQAQTITLPSLSLTQTYGYDALNRLTSAGEGSSSWSQTYGVDTFGNRWVSSNNNSAFPLSAFTPTASTNFDAGNHLLVDNSQYDPSGNGDQTAIGGTGGYAYTYDAENRIIGANLGSGATQTSSTGYVYDGVGQRVQKIACPVNTATCTAGTPGATTTTYIYDALGDLASELDATTPTSPCVTSTSITCYVSVDQIGSTRLVTDNNGIAKTRYDFLPSGEEIWQGIGGRTTGMGYQSGPDGFNPKFAGQMRDTESLLDYSNARYYSPQQYRFVSSDPENAGTNLADPQTWDGYVYVGNKPLTLTDPSGLGFWSDLFDILGAFFGVYGDIGGVNLPSSIPGTTGDISDSGPWNEQLPIGVGSAGLVDTGTVFGSGNTGPLVFSLTPTSGGLTAATPPVEGCSLSDVIVQNDCGAGPTSAASLMFFRRAAAYAGIGWSVAARYVGWRGEQIVSSMINLSKNTAFRLTGTVSGTNRIPDFVNPAMKIIYEVKNQSYVAFNSQIRDMAVWAQQNNFKFQLYVNSNATLSSGIEAARQAGLLTVQTFTFPF